MPRLTESAKEQMHIEILTEAFSLQEIGRRFNVSCTTVRRHKKDLEDRPDIREKFRNELQKQMIERDGKGKSHKGHRKSQRDRASDAPTNIEDATIKRAATMVVDVLEEHRRITSKGWIGTEKIQDNINSDTELDLRTLAQAQRQNTGSMVNLINADRKSYNIDDPGAGDDVPDAIHISFHRDKPPAEIEES